LDRNTFKYIVGIDEAGRGPLAGPVVASCVCFKKTPQFELRDSKKLSPSKREQLFPKIKNVSHYSFSLVNNKVIDDINIFNATQLAFNLAISRFLVKTNFSKDDVLFIIDGPHFRDNCQVKYKCVISADNLVPEVSAASILAKVLRDRIMISYDKFFPEWYFSQHKGYPTKLHRQAIKKQGFSPLHRLSFKSD